MSTPRFKKILFCPLGRTGNAPAYRRALELAHAHDSALTVLGVVAEPNRMHRVLQATGLEDRVQAAELARTTQALDELQQIDGEIESTTRVAFGRRSVAIIQHILTMGHDLVIVTTDEDGDDTATIRRLLRKCPCPVWVIRQARPRMHRVLAAVNPDPDEEELNLSILKHAAAMHAVYGGEVHIVHAWELYGESTMRHSSFIHIDEEEVDAMVEKERVRREALLDSLLEVAGLDDIPTHVHLVQGQPSRIIPTLVQRRQINLLVMGTIARAGLSGIIVGNTADNVLNDVRCSVLAIKPRDFVSPIPHPSS